ncbi:hypothetical protein GCM10009826_16120 [Humibacillus xanthopallidus]
MGTALGTLVVTTLLDLSWPVRIGLIVVVLVLGLAYVVWKNRAEIAAGAAAPSTGDAVPADPADPAGSADSADSADPGAGPPAPNSGH